MEGNIFINGCIGSMPEEKGVELIDIIQQVKAQPGATSFKVHINSEGGFVDVGFDIYNYLRSLGMPIVTIGNGLVASIATVIFMAGDRRILKENTGFMIHLPSGEVWGTADEIQSYADGVKDAENQLIDFYKKTTNLSKEALFPLLKQETFLTDEQALSLGFVTEKNIPVLARAYFNTNTDKMTKEESKGLLDSLNSGIDKIMNLIKKPIVNIKVQDATGAEIDFAEVMDGETVAVGAIGTVDGAPAEGEYLMPDGTTMVFDKGELKEIKEAAAAETEDVEAMKAELEALRQQVTDQATVITAKETEITAIQKEVKSFKAAIVSKLEVDTQKEKKEKETTDLDNRAAGMLERIKNLKK